MQGTQEQIKNNDKSTKIEILSTIFTYCLKHLALHLFAVFFKVRLLLFFMSVCVHIHGNKRHTDFEREAHINQQNDSRPHIHSNTRHIRASALKEHTRIPGT